MMKRFLLVFFFSLGQIQFSMAAQTQSSMSSDESLLSPAISSGMSELRIPTSSVGFSGYQTNNLGAHLDLRVWSFDQSNAKIKIFGSFIYGTGKNTQFAEEKIRMEETFVGLKIFPNSYLYFLAGGGPGKITLEENITRVGISYNSMALGLGSDIRIFQSFLVGGEVLYRSGSMKNSDTSSVPSSANYEGAGLFLKFTWTPSSSSSPSEGSKPSKKEFFSFSR